MRNEIDLLAAVTVLGVLEQAYFTLQVIYARRKYKISPPETTGHPEFERIFRAQVNCSEYFPIFISLLWVAGIFFHQGVAAACGMLYLYTRFRYFQGYALAAQGRLGPLYASARLLWLLVGLAVAGLLAHFLLLPSSPWALAWPLRLLNAW
ncbi:leukotriene C4 synthase-like isoform X1 [Cygnus olor]|uniref:leukotriene C4 synthase-like n=1 Tax=Cygnus atratus TaxID=8868 RepID=UPI0015D652ED|nr:leukotriene C4 synthase-like [Cygnus atratus]XP_040429397.1 leukotriene C4 synthase-like isoform X1 [Cygnus olor]